jgi:hypothetical protein
MEVHTMGTKYTWRGPKRNNHDRVFKKLDRVMCNSDWRLKYHEGFAKVLPRVQSDHHPIMLLSNGEPCNGGNRPFRFEAAWISHANFPRLINDKWDENCELTHTLSNLTPQLKDWNKDIFGNIFKRKRELLARLNGIQNSPHYGYSDFQDNLEKYLQDQLATTLSQEECFWYQKSRSQWIADGDRNTKYYHSKTIIRRRKSKISSLGNNIGNWIDEPNALKELVRQFYLDLFSDDSMVREQMVSRNTYPSKVENHQNRLTSNIGFMECKKALFEMGPYKAPGEDGYPTLFFQHCWDTIANSLFRYVNQVWVNPSLISVINNTLLVMIPKIDKPEFVSQFRPIYLCNVVYKIISKVIVNKIKPLLNEIISPFQSSFIPGRNIHHNIIVAQEMVHSMSRMKGQKVFMSIKIDLEKVYDRLNWNFIVNCLEECKFPGKLIEVIRHCITSPSYKIMWKGEKTNSFTPTRGIRQGDHLSPYLFVICMEKLSHIIADQVEANYWKPMRAGRNGPFSV